VLQDFATGQSLVFDIQFHRTHALHRPVLRFSRPYGQARLSACCRRANTCDGDPISCSHTRDATQTCLRNAEVTNLSLALFFASFSRQKVTFVEGAVQ
jgi:hypothetical protein